MRELCLFLMWLFGKTNKEFQKAKNMKEIDDFILRHIKVLCIE